MQRGLPQVCGAGLKHPPPPKTSALFIIITIIIIIIAIIISFKKHFFGNLNVVYAAAEREQFHISKITQNRKYSWLRSLLTH